MSEEIETIGETKEKISSEEKLESKSEDSEDSSNLGTTPDNKKKEEEKKEQEEKKKIKIRKPLDQSLLEALFFASGRPITVNRIAIEFGWEPKEVRQLIKDLAKKLDKTKAELQLLEVQRGKWVLHFPLDKYDKHFKGIIDTILIEYPKKHIHDTLIKKVLTSVAFHQPVSKPKLFKVISSENPDFTIQKLENCLNILVQEGFVRSNVSGRPIQYKTTGFFADEFGFDPVKAKLKQQLVKRLEKKK
jgi:chromosome segregation and condensation protein ScpB